MYRYQEEIIDTMHKKIIHAF